MTARGDDSNSDGAGRRPAWGRRGSPAPEPAIDTKPAGDEVVGSAPTMPGEAVAVAETVAAPASGVAATVASNAPPSRPSARGTLRPAQNAASDSEDLATLEPVDPRLYVFVREVARGGMGRILEARDRRLGRVVAVKELLGDGATLRARFVREARITAQLQHPSIVGLLEAGTWSDGKPFYAMRLVEGQPLSDVMAKAKTTPERLALLPHVLAIADALAYAHGRRVIHRDLKPGNVLVGDYGETVVIDWGLAKQLGDADESLTSDSVPLELPAAHDDAEMTAFGAVLGTPAFMPPEQATGLPADQRADVYAIGAILYALLTGRPPFVGRSSEEVITRVRTAAPAPLPDDLPPDLVAIIGKAMAKQPDDRYPSARELAADLRRFQTGQLVGVHRYTTRQLIARWLRKYRLPVGVGAAALAALAVISVIAIRRVIDERDRADAQRAVAERREAEAHTHRGAAEELVGFLFDRLYEKLREAGRLDLLEGLGTATLAYYDQLRAGGVDNEASDHALTLRGDGLSRLARVELERGNLAEGKRLAEAAIALYAVVEARTPTDRSAMDLTVGYQQLAQVAMATGDLSAAREAMLLYRDAAAKAAERAPGVENDRALDIADVELAGIELARGDLDQAREVYGRVRARMEQRTVDRPDLREAKLDVLTIYLRMTALEQSVGNLPAVSELANAGERRAAEWQRASPDDHVWQHRRALIATTLGDVEFDTGHHAEALITYQRSHEMLKELNALDPTNVEWRYDLSLAIGRVGDALGALGRVREAAAARTAWLAQLDALVTSRPELLEWRTELGIAQRTAGEEALAAGNLPAARKLLLACAESWQKLVDADPQRVDTKVSRAGCEIRVARVRAAAGEEAQARADADAIVRELDQLLSGADNPPARQERVTALLLRGELERRAGLATEAATTLRAGLADAEALSAANPDDLGRALTVIELRLELARALRGHDDAAARTELAAATAALTKREADGTLGAHGAELLTAARALAK